MKELLEIIILEHSILERGTVDSLTDTLINSFPDQKTKWSKVLWQFLDDCVLRLVRKPLKYHGMAQNIKRHSWTNCSASHRKSLSLLSVVLAEQWPFLEKRTESGNLCTTAIWLKSFLYASRAAGEDAQTIEYIRRVLWRVSTILQVKNVFETWSGCTSSEKSIGSETRMALPEQDSTVFQIRHKAIDEILRPPQEPDNHAGIQRWAKGNLLDAIDEGAIGDLVMCLCSDFQEIRTQAVRNCRLLYSKLEVSTRGFVGDPTVNTY